MQGPIIAIPKDIFQMVIREFIITHNTTLLK